MKFLVFLLILIGLLAVAASNYDVAASRPHGRVVSALLHEFLEFSIRREARGVEMSDVVLISQPEAAQHYRSMCEACHGAPGVDMPMLGKGLYPAPPELYVEEEGWSDKEIFWIVKHGIKFTGMPGFGSDHSDSELWGLAMFVKKLPGLSKEDYAAFFPSEARVSSPNQEGAPLRTHDHHQHRH